MAIEIPADWDPSDPKVTDPWQAEVNRLRREYQEATRAESIAQHALPELKSNVDGTAEALALIANELGVCDPECDDCCSEGAADRYVEGLRKLLAEHEANMHSLDRLRSSRREAGRRAYEAKQKLIKLGAWEDK